MSGSSAVYALIRQLAEKKIQIWTEDETLKFKAPKGAMDAELKNALIQHKQALIGFLKEQQQAQIKITARPYPQQLPLSHAQQRLWFIEQYKGENKNAEYNIPVVLHLRGNLHVEALEKAINAVIVRHEVLQTFFDSEKGFPKQRKVEKPFCQLALTDYSHLDESEQQLWVEQEIEQNIGFLFDLSQWPLFKLQLIKKSDGYIFLATMHHIIADGWSMDVLVREIAAHYQYFSHAQLPPMTALSLQYADYAHWQQQWMSDSASEQQLRFWENYLQDMPVLELPLDKLRDKASVPRGAHKKFAVDSKLQADLHAYAKQHGVTLYMLLSAAFSLLLSRFSKQNDINLGIPIANRNRPEWEPLIGFFVNTLVLRNDLSSDPLFSEFLRQVQENTLAIYANQDLPFDRVVEALVSERDSGFSPLFQVMFSLQNTPGQQALHLPGLEIEVLDSNIQSARYDMTWNLLESDKGIEIDVEYRSDLFFASTIDLYAKYFEYLLTQVISCADQKISEYRLQDAQETLQQILAFHPSALPYPREAYIAELFEESVAKYGQRIALRHGDKVLDYQTLAIHVDEIAASLQQSGVTENDRVVIALHRSIDMIEAILAVLKLGACYVPLDPDYPDERKNFIVKDSAACLLITNSQQLKHLHLLKKNEIKILLLDKDVSDVLPKANTSIKAANQILFKKNSGNKEACIFYTSGSTGEPKGVIVPHRGIVRLVKNTNFAPYDEQQVVAHISNVCFDAASMEIWGALLNGGCLEILDKETITSATAFEQALQQSGITIMFLTAGLFKVLAYEKPTMFFRVRALLVGGDILDMNALRKVLRSGAAPEKILNGYGPTENCTFSCSHWIKSVPDNAISVPIGKAIHHSKALIVDEKGRLLPAGINGELLCAGDGLALGYLNQDALTREKFVTGFISDFPDERVYLTGDLARYTAEGDIYLTGRMDMQIKIRGFRIEPGEIESTLEKIAGVDKAVVLVKNRDNGEKNLVAYLVLSAGSQCDMKSVQAEARLLMPAYMQPGVFQQIKTLPLNANGKVDRKTLPEIDWQQISSQQYQAPQNALEQRLCEIWCALLAIEKVGINDNFFELGGHSLLATRLLSRIQETFALELSVKQVFEHPTVALLAKEIEKHQLFHQQDIAAPLTAIARDTAFYQQAWPLSKAQQRLWFMYQLEPDSSAYGVPMAVAISEQLDISRLQNSLLQVIQRHESLRTAFVLLDGEAKQRVNAVPQHFKLEQVEIDSEQQLQAAIAENQRHVFNLESGPLFICRLLLSNFTESTTPYLLLMNMHHIISDGWSMQLLRRDLLSLYQQQSSTLPELPVQYVDYSVWQQQWLDDSYTEKLLTFWKDYLAGVQEVLHLPYDKSRPAQQSFRGAVATFALDKNLQQQALQFCREKQITSFVLGIAAYALLLSRYAQQNDFCIGIPVAGRKQSELENIIGFFVNGLVVRSDICENDSIETYLEKIKDSSMAVFAHQDLSADVLIDALGIKPNSAYQPLAQVAFAHQHYSDHNNISHQVNGINFVALPAENHSAKYDLMFSLADTGEQLQLACEYSSDLFEQETVNSMLKNYQAVLVAMLENPKQKISEICWYSNEEILASLNNKYHASYSKAFLLSPNQQAIYLDALINPDTVQNSIANMLDLNQPIDNKRWQQAFAYLQAQHDIFRTDFRALDLPGHHQIYQCINSEAKAAFHYIDLSQKQFTFENLQTYVESEAYCTYNIESDVLYQYYLYKLADNHYAAMLRAHHVLFDGISGKIFLEEILKLYQHLHDGNKAEAFDFSGRNNFSDFVSKQNRSSDSQACLAFWRQQLGACAALAFDAKEKNQMQGKVYQKNLSLDASQSAAIRSFCKQQAITPAIFFKSLYAALIYQYCRPEADFYLLEFSHGRSREFENSYGVYYQQTPFVVPLDLFENEKLGKSLFDSLFLHARNFQKTSRIWRDFSVQAQRGLLPFGNIGFMYNYTRFEGELAFMGKQEQSVFLSPRAEAQVQLFIREHDKHFECLLLFADDTFSDYALLERLNKIAGQLVAAREEPFFTLLLRHEQQQLQAVNTEKSEFAFEPLLKKFEENLAKDPKKIAVQFAEKKISYQSLHEQSNRLAGYLTVHYLQNKTAQRIGLYLPLNEHYLIALLAIVKSGAAYVPIQIDYPADRIQHMVDTAQLALVLSVTQMKTECENNLKHCAYLLLDEMEFSTETQTNTAASDANSSLYAIYTSGSTGLPKGAEVSHSNALNLLQWYENTLGLCAHDKSIIISAAGFDLTQKNFFALLRCGGSLFLPDMALFDPDYLRQQIATQQITHINCAPSAFYALLDGGEKSWQQLSSLRHVVLGGEALVKSELKGWFENSSCKARLFNSYGPTECSDVVSYYEVQANDFSDNNSVPLGKAINNAELYIVNPNLEYLPAGLVGEIAIGGACLGKGYIGQNQLNNIAFVDIETLDDGERGAKQKVYLSGDLGRINSEGQLAYLGRKDFQIKLRGQRIELGEIEQALRSLPQVRDALVNVVDDNLVAWLTSDVISELSTAKLQEALARKLASYMLPKQILLLEKWPLNINGKIDRKALPAPDFTRVDSKEKVLPRNSIEQKIADIWCAVLGLEEVSVYDGFFELGGHSLLATKAVSRMKENFDVEFPLKALFDLHTISEIAEYIKTLQWAVASKTQKGKADDANGNDGSRDEGFI